MACNKCYRGSCSGSCGNPSVSRQIRLQNNSIGRDGESAYETYLRMGGTLTEAEWLESLKGEQGPKGDGVQIKGSVEFYGDLFNIDPSPEVGDSWIVNENGMLYVYGEMGFPSIDQGIQIQGEPGNDLIPDTTTNYFDNL